MNWKRALQLALVHVGVTITVVPVTGTLNRIMIYEMGLAATVVSFLVALPYLLSPIQVAIGDWTDRHALWGRHRSPWMVIGGLMACFGSYMTVHTVLWMETNFALGLAASVGVFLIWGTGVNISSVSYLSLVTDLSEGNERWRSRTVSFMWSAMILSTIVIAILVARLLEPYSHEALVTAFGFVWLIASLFVLIGSARVEPPPVSGRTIHNTADSPGAAYRLVARNPSARRFFIYLLIVLVSIYAQDVLLEPFGAEALGMSVASTSRLTALWGVGFFITLIGGLAVMRRIGKKSAANLGALVTALAFAAIILTGVLRLPGGFMGAVLLLGLGGGLMTVSNLSFMLDMTVPQAAGLYIGAWSVANFAGRAIGTLSSGALRDAAHLLTGNALAGYITVFALEIVGLLLAIWLFRRISVEEFRRDAEVRLADLLALVGD